MIERGTIAINRLTGSRWEVLEGAAETGSCGFSIKITCQPRAAPDVSEHVHLDWDETFEILSGHATYSLQGEAYTAVAGDTLEMPPRQSHVHPWNDGDEPLVYIQRARFPAPQPGAFEETFGVILTLFGMAAKPGLLNRRGMPRDLLAFAAMGRAFGRYRNYDAAVPILLQRAASATLGRLAEARGIPAINPAYIALARPGPGE
ncbi:cupin domain-containing protein [Fluviibacterium sp. S390]|uniref:cupin domain-containing protein n=1 Tax=Fluviibacterium sp. S390 TaxID=3415139 RepID=UPI003C7B8E2C